MHWNYRSQIPGKGYALVLVAPALKAYGPNALVANLISKGLKTYNFKADTSRWGDPALHAESQLYERPHRPIVEFIRFTEFTRNPERLRRLTVPFLILATTRDKVVYTSEMQRLYDLASSKDKSIKWFHKSCHEMLLDCESEQVLNAIEDYVAKLKQKSLIEAS